MAGDSVDICEDCSIIKVFSTLNMRPRMDLVAFFTYIINFSDLKMVSFMAYTYNIQG